MKVLISMYMAIYVQVKMGQSFRGGEEGISSGLFLWGLYCIHAFKDIHLVAMEIEL